jgi:uncharacterized protein YdeI (YjbR/CyaY-like superfamily)
MINTENFIKVEISSSNQLKNWLQENYKQEESVWLVTYKKVIPENYVSTSEILDELLSFGWIDGTRRKLDNVRTMQLISPRKTQHWSNTYKVRAAKLIKNGKMQAPGIKSIEESKKNGNWDFLDDVDKLIIPNDLDDALSQFPGAKDFFYAINNSSKRFVLRWIKLAKQEKTRQNRIKKIAYLSAKGEKLPGS